MTIAIVVIAIFWLLGMAFVAFFLWAMYKLMIVDSRGESEHGIFVAWFVLTAICMIGIVLSPLIAVVAQA